MALGLLLWISWTCALLFNGSVGLPAAKGQGYLYKADSRNLGEDKDDEILRTPKLGQSNWQTTNSRGTVNNQPSVVKPPDCDPTKPNLPSTPSVHEVVRLVKVESSDGRLGNLNNPLFPLRPYNQLSDLTKPQSSASNSESWQSEVRSDSAVLNFGFGSQNQDFNTGSNTDGSGSKNNPHLLFEEVFKFPSNTVGLSDTRYGKISTTVGKAKKLGFSHGTSTPENPSARISLSKVRNWPASPSQKVSRFSKRLNLGFSPGGQKIVSWFLQQPFFTTEKYDVFQRASQPTTPRYILQSRNGYRRSRLLFTKSDHSPEFPTPMAIRSKDVKGAAPIKQPLKGVKNLERTKWEPATLYIEKM